MYTGYIQIDTCAHIHVLRCMCAHMHMNAHTDNRHTGTSEEVVGS